MAPHPSALPSPPQGIFSLALPHRTGSQCRHFYLQSRWYRPEEETASPPLAAVRACLGAARPQTRQLWASEVAAQVETRVEAWLQGKATPGSVGVKVAGAGAPAAAAATAAAPLASFAFRPSERHQQQSGGWPKPGLGPRLANQKPTARPPRKKTATAAKPPPPPKRRAKAIDSSEDDDDEFVAGTLRKVQVVEQQKQAPPAAAAPAAAAASGRPKASGGGKRTPRGARADTLVMMGAAAGGGDFDPGDGGGADADAITVIRLDKDKAGALPGWGRRVRPYIPPGPAPTPPPGALVFAPDLLRFDFATLGAGAFSGAIVNAPLAGDPALGVTPTQLAAMALPDCLAPDAIVCVWASKAAVGETVAAMAKAWDCKYVENLTWVHLGPGGAVARAPAPLAAASHATLVMGRRGKGALELRHQRSPDVIVEPALGAGRFPDGVREMLETLLPEGKGGSDGGGGGAQRAPRFLEVAFHGAEPGARPGWAKLVQAPRGEG